MTAPAHPGCSGSAPSKRRRSAGPLPPAGAACEPLEARRLLIAAAPLDVVSITPDGRSTGDGPSGVGHSDHFHTPAAAVSDDGRYVAFASAAGDLDAEAVAGGGRHVYVRDRSAGVTRRVATAADRAEAPAEAPEVSGDGRYVVYAQDLAFGSPGDVNGISDVYAYDTAAGTSSLVSVGPAGEAAGGYLAAVSRDGRFVAFVSDADLAGDGQGGGVFRRDLSAGATARVSPPGVGFYGGAHDPVKPRISDDGNVVAWRSPRTDARGFIVAVDVYVRDMTTGAAQPATVAPDGSFAGDSVRAQAAGFALSGDGRHVAFATTAAAVPQDANGAPDVYVRDLAAGTTVIASAGPDGAAPAGVVTGAHRPAISRDGRVVAFNSDAVLTAVPDPDPPGAPRPDVYVRDLRSGVTRLASADLAGTGAAGGQWASLSDDGRRLAFSVFYDDRVAGPPPPGSGGPFSHQVLVMDTLSGERALAGAVRPGGWPWALDGAAGEAPAISRDGTVVVFTAGRSVQRESDTGGGAFPGVSDVNRGADLLAAKFGPPPAPPEAVPVVAGPVQQAGTSFLEFAVTWTDAAGIDATTLGDGDVIVTGPNGYRRAAVLHSLDGPAGGTSRVARYRAPARGEVLEADDNGTYAVEVAPDQVYNAAGVPAPAGPIVGAAIPVDIPLPDGPDLRATLGGALPAAVMPGARYRGKPLLLTITNHGNAPAAGQVATRITLSADDLADPAAAANAPVIVQMTMKVRLAPGQSRAFRVRPRAFPAAPDGDYRVLARVDMADAVDEQLEDNNVAALPGPVRVAAPFVDVGISDVSLSGRLARGKKATLQLAARNEGNQTARGVQPARVRITTNPADPAAASHAADVALRLNLKAGATRALRAKVALPAGLSPGTYIVVVELLAGAPWGDADPSDDAATGAAFSVA